MDRQPLERHFDPGQIRQRKGDEGKMYEYIAGADVIQRLNEIFEAEWSFEVLDHHILDNEVVVLGKLLAGGVEKMQFGSVPITRRKSDKSAISVGDDLKKAGTDALKKCATLLGIGLQLYFKKAAAPARSERPAAPNSAAPAAPIQSPVTTPSAAAEDSDRITAKQLTAITQLSGKRGWTQMRLRDYTMENFQQMPDRLTREQGAALINRLQLQAVAS